MEIEEAIAKAIKEALPGVVKAALEASHCEHKCVMFTPEEGMALREGVSASRTIRTLIISGVALSIVGVIMATFYLGIKTTIKNVQKSEVTK